MEVGKLTVQRRYQTGKGTARKLRAQGLVPAICYGATLEEPMAITLDPRALRASLDPQKKQNTVIDVTVEDNGATAANFAVMVRDFQLDRIRHDLEHVDLYAIDTEKRIEVEIPIEFTGKAAGLVEGGQLHVVRHSLNIWAKPADIPAKLVVDVSPLNIGDVLHISDLTLPEGVEFADPPRLTVITCAAPEADAKAAEAEDADAAPAKKKK